MVVDNEELFDVLEDRRNEILGCLTDARFEKHTEVGEDSESDEEDSSELFFFENGKITTQFGN